MVNTYCFSLESTSAEPCLSFFVSNRTGHPLILDFLKRKRRLDSNGKFRTTIFTVSDISPKCVLDKELKKLREIGCVVHMRTTLDYYGYVGPGMQFYQG
jgi:hypothetical protein